MSYFADKILTAIESSIRVKCIREYEIGTFRSGYTNNVIRKADMIMQTSKIYGLTKDCVIEVQGVQHYDKDTAKTIARNAPKWKDKFYDTVLRDRWEESLLQQKDILLIRFMPIYWDGNSKNYRNSINKLAEKVASPGYMDYILREAHIRKAHGVEIDEFGSPIFYKRRKMKSPKLPIDK